MKDIDFDELDRAVNSLISPSSTPAAPAEASTAVPVQVTTGGVSPTLSSPAERRSSGRFMDVVHPSSDMRPSTTPSSETVSPPASQLTPDTSPVSSPEPSAPTSPTWPDPVATQEDTSKTTPDPVADAASEAATTPLESPFLTDTKVEKRPLGAFSTDIPPEPLSSSSPTTPPEAQAASPAPNGNAKSSDHPIGGDTPLPAELQSDVLSIESNEDTATEETPETPETTPPAPVVEPVGPTSITQQYSEQPSTGDKPTGSVFDTEAYKKPQPKQKKKKTGWLIVLWIFLLLIVGAGIGAAIYFLVLPHIG